MKIDGVSFNEAFAKNSEKKAWIERHFGFFGHLSEADRRKHLSAIYDRLNGKTNKTVETGRAPSTQPTAPTPTVETRHATSVQD